MKKKFLAVLLSVIMIVSVVPGNMILSSFAASAVTSVESTAVLAVQQQWATPGDTVDVNLVVSENPGILGATLVVSWDERMTLVADASGEAFSHMTYTSPSRYTAAGTNFVWFGNEVDEAVDGIALTLTFQISETVENNDFLPVYVTYARGDVIDGNDNDVTLSITDGYIRIITYKPGDVNGDNRVNSRDLVRLSQYISDGCKTDPDGYNAEVIADACDVNADGRVNARDLIRLSQYISDGSQTNPEGYNATLNPAKIPECKHSCMVKTDYKAPSCTEAGVNEHWYCADCTKYFADADGVNEIAYANTIIAATGHTVVIDEAVAPTYDHTGLTEGSHCSVCNETIVAQQTVPALEATYHAITYKNLNGAKSPSITSYAEHIGMLDMPEISVPGYRFLGWYTASENGEKVDYILAGDTKEYVLFAHWELISYTITYKNAAKNSNPATYTIDDEITLVAPEWSGLIFSRWSDKNGETVTKIERGTIGNIELEANWNYAKNLAVSNPDKYTYIGGMMDSRSRYYFIYNIGTIENIVLYTQYVQKYDGSTNVNREQSVTYKVQLSEAQSASRTIANSVIKSTQWKNMTEFVSSHQEGVDLGAKYCPEIEIEGIKVKAYEFTAGWSKIDKDSYTETNVRINDQVDGTEITNQTASSISFLTENETTSTVNVQLSKDVSPVGVYSYVRAADVKVFAIVTYDPANGEYYLDLYSQVYRVFDTTLFELSGNEQYLVNIESHNQLDFEIPYEQIPNQFYTVEYNSNGGSGEMLKSVHELGVSSALLSNGFTKTGYTFGGWKTVANGTIVLYANASAIRDIAVAGETVKLYAHWIANTYTVQYNANKPSNASSSVLNVPGKATCSYDTGFTLGSTPALTGWTFGGWYLDKACTVKAGGAGDVTRNLTTEPNATITLYAKWTAKTYTIVFNSNGGSGSIGSMTCTYDQSYSLPANGFSRHGWTFVGWSTNPSATSAMYTDGQSVQNLTNAANGKVTLYAVWNINVGFTVKYSSIDVGRDDRKGASINLCDYVDLNALKSMGYTKVTLVQKFKVTKTSNDKNAYVCSQVCFDGYNGTLWLNSPDDVTGGRRYTNIHYFTNGASSADLVWTNTRNLDDHTAIYFTFSSYNPWSIFVGYQCSYNLSNYEVEVIFSK